MRAASSWIRFAPVLAVMLATALFLRARSKPEAVPAHKNLADFPTEIGNWSDQRNIEIDADTLAILGPGKFMERLYESSAGSPFVDLFVAYFPSQRTNDTIHSPEHCLPGAGWIPVERSRFSLQVPGEAPIHANRWVIARGADRQIVLYWYQAHGRTQASEYVAKFYLVADAIRMNRTDGALVRIITPLAEGENAASGERRAVSFAKTIAPLLASYIPN